jgi:hypothetical protein
MPELQQQEEQQAAYRNRRSVWEIATEPYSGAHFAVMPSALVEPCIKAGTSERGCCVKCGAPWVRETSNGKGDAFDARRMDGRPDGAERRKIGGGQKEWDSYKSPQTVGWYPSWCDGLRELRPYPRKPARDAPEDEHDAWRGKCLWIELKRDELCRAAAPIKTLPAVCLDPFGGAGTTGLVADRLRRDAILVEISDKYAEMARRRISDDAPLFAQVAAE